MAKGWISLHRKIQECDIWLDDEPFDRRSAWIDLLLSANHEDKSMIFDGHSITIGRGQLITSVRKLASRWGWGKNKTLTYLRLLEELQMIERKADSRRTLLTIINYDVYQNGDGASGTVTGQSRDTEGTVTGHRQATNNNINNINNNNKRKKTAAVYYPENEQLDNTFKDYIKMRKEIKAPMSERAITLSMNRLKELSGGDDDKAIAIIEQSILKSWKGLFELHSDYKPAKQTQFHHTEQNTYDYDEIEKRLLGG